MLYHKPHSEFANASCRSKYEHPCYCKNLPVIPPTFLSALHAYELYHEKCTRGINITALGVEGEVVEGCKYLVWKAKDGMGNQLLSLVCAFIYSLLTQRAMLIATDSHIQNYLCDPFPLSSWLLPHDFPEPHLRTSAKRVADYIAETVEQKADHTHNFSATTPKHLQVYINCCDKRHDHPFFCPGAQNLCTDINWIFYHSHEHTLPAFYLIPEFRNKLTRWFPNHDAFMHVSRYLLHPQDAIWEHISEFYKAHMDGVPRLLGIQARVWNKDYKPTVSRQISRCIIEQTLLPKHSQDAINKTAEALASAIAPVPSAMHVQKKQPDILVLVASLRPEYKEDLAVQYAQNDGADGGLHVTVITASAERSQRTGNGAHDVAAIVDIWLLSFMHEMVVTPYSTFGSVASGMAGIVPLLMINYGKQKMEEAACVRNNVAGPCFLVYPRNQTCELDGPSFAIADPASMVPEVRYCERYTGLGVQSSFYIP
ncbi:hypothetical protein GOP47_0004467 [Adiantum capillus-veneris]|uniref:Fucosyltransferase n=1 Tax=Adiantum capillus-veneris TaxID=13818 RepID=A0A9D4V7L4_ADICA|nr:hypothetical protein GOP47_0004467 [Adiantum capillus-veneris]